jgi:hypothetical protein
MKAMKDVRTRFSMSGVENTTNAMPAPGPNPRRIHFNAGSTKDSSGASFAQES